MSNKRPHHSYAIGEPLPIDHALHSVTDGCNQIGARKHIFDTTLPNPKGTGHEH